jgi:hypothetical protein
MRIFGFLAGATDGKISAGIINYPNKHGGAKLEKHNLLAGEGGSHYKGFVLSWVRKILSLAVVLLIVSLVLNLNIGGRPSREIALDIWKSPGVQKVYSTVKNRLLALIRKDISVEDVFKPELPALEKPASSSSATPTTTSEDSTKVIHLEKLDEKDRKALEQILKKASK